MINSNNLSHIEVWHDKTSDFNDPYYIVSVIDLDGEDYPKYFRKEINDAITIANLLSDKMRLSVKIRNE